MTERNKDRLCFVGFLIAVFGIVGFIVYVGVKGLSRETAECAAKGGAYVKQYSGYVCVKAEKI